MTSLKKQLELCSLSAARKLLALAKADLRRYLGWAKMFEDEIALLKGQIDQMEQNGPRGTAGDEALANMRSYLQRLCRWRDTADQAAEKIKTELLTHEQLFPEVADEDRPARSSDAWFGLARHRGQKGVSFRSLDSLNIVYNGQTTEIWLGIKLDLPPLLASLLIELARDTGGQSNTDGLVPFKSREEIAKALDGKQKELPLQSDGEEKEISRRPGATRELIRRLRCELEDRWVCRLFIETAHGGARIRVKSPDAQTPVPIARLLPACDCGATDDSNNSADRNLSKTQ